MPVILVPKRGILLPVNRQSCWPVLRMRDLHVLLSVAVAWKLVEVEAVQQLWQKCMPGTSEPLSCLFWFHGGKHSRNLHPQKGAGKDV